MGPQNVLLAFAIFMANFLVLNGMAPAPKNQEEADILIKLVIRKFDEFSMMMNHVQNGSMN